MTTYSNRSDAIRAARTALSVKVRDPLSGVHFCLQPIGSEWAWHEIDVRTGNVAIAERLEDGSINVREVEMIVEQAVGFVEDFDRALRAHRPDAVLLDALPPFPGDRARTRH